MTVTATPDKTKEVHAGVIAGAVVAGVIIISIPIAWAILVHWRRGRTRQGVALKGHGAEAVAGKKYSELANSPTIPFSLSPTKDGTPDARFQGNAQLSGGERWDASPAHRHELGQALAIRHELGTQS